MSIRNSPNPYAIAVLTALLSGSISIIGFYFTANLQAQNAITQKKYEYRASAYNSFLSSMHRNESPVISEILSIGNLAGEMIGDEEIKILEDKFSQLSALNNKYKISLQIGSDFGILRLHGSDKVRAYCDDILSVLALQEHSVTWSNYPKELKLLRDRWVGSQANGMDYGYQGKVTGEERVMFVLLSALYKNLLSQLRAELYEKA